MVKSILVSVSLWMTWTGPLSACLLCRAKVAAEIYNPDFNFHLFLMLFPVLVLMVIGLGFYGAGNPRNGAGRR